MGLLDYLQQDPNKQEALRQGLLNAGIAMMGSQSPNFLGSAAQGASSGMQAYTKQFEEQKRKIAQQQAMQAATKPSTPAVYGVGGNVGNADFAQMAAGQNRDINALSALPRMDKPYSIPQGNGVSTLPLKGVPAPVPQPIEQPVDEAALQMAVNQEQGAPEMPADVLPEQIQQIQPAQAGGFDVRRYAEAVMQNPDNPEAAREFAFKLYLEHEKANRPSEQFGKIMPHAYTPDSLATYQKSGNYADLKPITGGKDFGKVNPGQFTPESLARYAESGQWGDLVPFRAPIQIDQGDRKTLYDPGSRQQQSFQVNPKVDDTPEYKAAQTQAVEGARMQVERQSNAPKAKAALSSFETKTKNLNSHIDAATKQAGFWTTGFMGNLTDGVAGTPSHDLSKRLDSIKASLGFAELQAMRDTSPTGGALGNITERELALLQSAWDSVAQSQSKGQFVAALKNVKEINALALKNAREAYDLTYNKQQPASAGSSKAGTLSPREILQSELRDAEARGDTRNAGHIREELRRMGVKATVNDLPKKPPVRSKQDNEAVTWARANPNDPRSAKILRLNGQ